MTCALSFLSPQERARELKAGHQYHKEQVGGALSALGDNIKGLVGGGNKHNAGDDASQVGGDVRCFWTKSPTHSLIDMLQSQDVLLGIGCPDSTCY